MLLELTYQKMPSCMTRMPNVELCQPGGRISVMLGGVVPSARVLL